MASLYSNIGLGISFEQQPQGFSQGPPQRRPEVPRRRSSGSFERPPTMYQEALRRLPNTTQIPQMPFDAPYMQMPQQQHTPPPQQQQQSQHHSRQQQQQPVTSAYNPNVPQYAMPRSAGPPQMPFSSPPRRVAEYSVHNVQSAPNTPYADRRHRPTRSLQHLSPYPQRSSPYRSQNYASHVTSSAEEVRNVRISDPQASYMYQTPVVASPYSDYGHFTHVDSYHGSPVLMDSPAFGMDCDDRVAYFDHLEIGMPDEPYVPAMQTNFPPRPLFKRTATETTFASMDTGYNMGTNDSPVSSPDPEPLAIPSVRRKKTTTYSRWSEEEDVMLRQAIDEHGVSKWALVATMVPGRTPMQCSTRWQGALNTSIHKGKWLPEEDAILVKAVAEWQAWHTSEDRGVSTPDELQEELVKCIPWANIAATLPRSRTGVQALARWSEALDPRIKKGKWTTEEDASLMFGIQQHGKCWIKVAAAVHGRTQRQCRTRFMQITERKVKDQKTVLAPPLSTSGGWSE